CRGPVGAGLGGRQALPLRLPAGPLATDRLVLIADAGDERVAAILLDEGAGHADRSRRIEDADDGPRGGRGDTPRGVRPRGRPPADEERDREPLALHLG